MPTNATRRADARRQDRIIQQAAPALRAAVAREKNIYIRQCAEAYRNTNQFREEDFVHHERRLRDILLKHYVRIGRIFNKEIFNQFKAQKPSLERKQESRFEYLLNRWARIEAGRKAKPIAGTTRKDIARAVQKSFASEEPETLVIRGILSTRGYSNFRANAVALTETHNAAMYASRTTAEDFAADEGVTMLKIWSPTLDDRTRDSHAEMESHPAISLSDLFDVQNPKGGVDRMNGPGDPSAPAEQVINCRCVLTYEVQ